MAIYIPFFPLLSWSSSFVFSNINRIMIVVPLEHVSIYHGKHANVLGWLSIVGYVPAAFKAIPGKYFQDTVGPRHVIAWWLSFHLYEGPVPARLLFPIVRHYGWSGGFAAGWLVWILIIHLKLLNHTNTPCFQLYYTSQSILTIYERLYNPSVVPVVSLIRVKSAGSMVLQTCTGGTVTGYD